MSLASRLLTAIVGLALIWFFWPFGGNDEVVKTIEPPPTGHQGRLFTTELPEGAPPPEKPKPPKTPQAPPDGATAKPDGKDGKKLAAVAPAKKQKLKPKRFYRVRVLDGGTLEASGVVIKLDGINPIPSDETCKDASGTKWLCGTRARMALTRLIRGRAVVCKVPEKDKKKTLTARCTLAREDLSLWMVSQGWAKPTAPVEPKLAKAAIQARKKKIGIWR